MSDGSLSTVIRSRRRTGDREGGGMGGVNDASGSGGGSKLRLFLNLKVDQGGYRMFHTCVL